MEWLRRGARRPIGTWIQREVPSRWKRWPWNAIVITVALALIGLGVYLPLRPDGTSCATGVEKVQHTCVGVTDGSYVFGEKKGKEKKNLAEVFAKVHEQNNWVTERAADKNGPSFVTVVYLMSMVPGPGDTNTPDSVRHEVEGAYTAQWEANRSSRYGDTPMIKLLLAHTGDTPEQRAATLEQIGEWKRKWHIVAVAGLGTSTDATATTIRKITKDEDDGGLHLAAVGSVLTADTLADVPGLVRVAPVNSDEAAAAAAFLSTKRYAHKRVMVIRDERADDQYTKTLANAFLDALPHDRLTREPETYDSSQGGVATAFMTRMANLCAQRPDVVYFAGRGIDLPHFLAPLKARTCSKRPLLVISGDDASQTAQAKGFDDIKDTLLRGNVRLVYTGLAHPDAWKKEPSAYPGWGRIDFGAHNHFRAVFKEESLYDGQAIMGHDAVLTAVRAIRLVADASGTNNGDVTGPDVIQSWHSLHGVDAVKGASGLISFHNDGSPERKAVPVIEIRADGSVRALTVSARGGRPVTTGELSGG